MAHGSFNGLSENSNPNSLKLDIGEKTVELPDNSYVRDADIMRDGLDLILKGPDGAITIEGYFGAETAPNLVAPDGVMLTPELVHSFVQSNGQYANAGSMNDVSPVGEVHEVSGQATVTRTDGTVDDIQIGTRIFQGDVVETNADGAVNIVFVDETSFAVSEDARLAIDEFVFDPSTNSGAQNFSVLKGVFVFTSGLIGREDPDDVEIDTPIGSIGIRGTIIAGDIDAGEITVVEGAIVVKDFSGNEMTLANQFETARLDPTAGTIENMGELSANDVGTRFSSVSNVAPSLFSSINDAAQDAAAENVNPDGSVDQDNDGDVDSTINAETDENAPQADADAPVDGEAVDQPAPTGETTTKFNSTEFGDSNDSFTDGTSAPAQTQQTAPSTSGSTTAPPAASTGGTVNGTSGTTAPQQNTTTDPRVLDGTTNNTTGGAANGTAPTHVAQAAVESFVSMEGLTWKYNFDNDFKDVDSGDTLTYQLDAATIDTLNSLTNDNTGGGSDVLSDTAGTGVDGSELTVGWSFDSTTGELILFGHDNFENGLNHTINITVRAVDSAGNTSSWHNYNVDMLDASSVNYTGTTLTGVNGAEISGTDGINNLIFGTATESSDNVYHAGLGDDTVTIADGNNNTIYLGDGNNTATVQSDNINNTIIGGRGRDTFNVQDAQNTFKGLGGDDNFVFDFTNAPDAITQLQTMGDPDIQIEGGNNGSRTLGVLGDMNVSGFENHAGTNTATTGRGDSLIFEGAGNIDFTAVDDGYIVGIERLDFNNGAANEITLNYTDVVQMTEGQNTLLINLDASDQLSFDAESNGFTKVADNVTVDNSEVGGTADNLNYDVYTDGNVTLLVQDNGANVTGLPA